MAPSDRERSGSTVTTGGGGAAAGHGGPVHVRGEVLAVRRAGAYRVVSLAAPGVPATFRPGSFVKVARTDDGDGADGTWASGTWWIHRVEPASAFGPTVELVVDPAVGRTAWLSRLPVGTPVAVTGALGRPFSLPKQAVPTLLVGEGDAISPLLALAERLRERGCTVTLLLGAEDEQHLLSAREARRLARELHVVTRDGSVGRRAAVADVLEPLVTSSGAAVVYAAGTPEQCRRVAEVASAADVPSQVALQVPLPCGTGLCHGCVVPVTVPEGTRQVRACVEGPVLPGHRVDWPVLVGLAGPGTPEVAP